MATIARGAKAGGGTNYNSGQTIDPDEVNLDFNTLYTEVNGALDDGNVETATIPGAKSLRFTEISAPSSPSSNDGLVYAKDDGTGRTRLYLKESDGTETQLALLGGARGEVLNLRVKSATANPTFQVDIDADALDVEGFRCTAVDLTCDLTASGANGLDTSTEASDTNYYIWVIRKSTDGTVGSLFSTSSTAPTMPSGYDQKRLVSAVRNQGSNLVLFTQSNDLVLAAPQTVSNGISASADADFSLYMPGAIADHILIEVFLAGSGTWQVVDKDTPFNYLETTSTARLQLWVRKNASNLLTQTEVSGTATFTLSLKGWKVKVL